MIQNDSNTIRTDPKTNSDRPTTIRQPSDGLAPALARIQNDNSNPGFGGPAKNFEKKSNFFCTKRSFVPLLVRSKIFQILVWADAINLVQKSSNFEPSSRFFGRLKILNSKRRRNEAFEFDSRCRAPQRALQLESKSIATV